MRRAAADTDPESGWRGVEGFGVSSPNFKVIVHWGLYKVRAFGVLDFNLSKSVVWILFLSASLLGVLWGWG